MVPSASAQTDAHVHPDRAGGPERLAIPHWIRVGLTTCSLAIMSAGVVYLCIGQLRKTHALTDLQLFLRALQARRISQPATDDL